MATTGINLNDLTLGAMQRAGGFAIFDAEVREEADKWAVVYTLPRDAEPIDESNFAAFCERLGFDTEKESTENPDDTARIRRFGCSMRGHVDHLMVDVTDPTIAATAVEVLGELDAYPILDEDDFSEREEDEKTRYVEEETPSHTDRMPADTTDDERSRAAWYGRERHEQTGGPVEDYATEENFAYGVARVMLEKGYTSDQLIIGAMSYADRFSHPDTPESILDEARTDHTEKKAA